MSLKDALTILSRKPRSAKPDDDETEDREDDAPDDDEDPDDPDEEDDADEGDDEEEEDDEDEEDDKKSARARRRERARIAAILDAPAATGREDLARHLACRTNMKAADAIAALEASPKAATGPSPLAAAMAAVPNPDVGPDGGGQPEGPARIAAMAAQIVDARMPRK